MSKGFPSNNSHPMGKMGAGAAVSMLTLLLMFSHGALSTDVPGSACSEEQAMKCHHLAYCEAGVCSCPEGFWGDGYGSEGCQKHAASIQLAITLPGSDVDHMKLSHTALAPIKRDIKKIFADPPHFDSAFHHSALQTLAGNKGSILMQINVLYKDLISAKHALQTLDFTVDPETQQLEYFDAGLKRKSRAVIDNSPLRVSGDQSVWSMEKLPTAQLWAQETLKNVKTTLVFAGLAATTAAAPSPPAPPRATLPTKDPRKIRLPRPQITA